jgi:hypothetical protein
MPHDFTKQWFPPEYPAAEYEKAKRAMSHAESEVERAIRHKEQVEKRMERAIRRVHASCPLWADFLAEVKAHPGAKWRWISRWNFDADRTFHLTANDCDMVASAEKDPELLIMEATWPHHFTTALLWRIK